VFWENFGFSVCDGWGNINLKAIEFGCQKLGYNEAMTDDVTTKVLYLISLLREK
jgi:hypothetical protein